MSSKFSRTTQTMKPPHICNKPPPGPEYVPPPFDSQIITGYAAYFNPETEAEGGFISPLTLHPSDPPSTWSGSTTAGSFKMDMEMAAYGSRDWLSFIFRFYNYGDLIETIEIDDHVPRSWIPFDTGQVTPWPPPIGGNNSWRFWS